MAPVCFVILAYCRHSNKLFKRRSFYRCYAVIKTELVCIYFFATGTTQSSINRYENGQATPTVDLLRKYADYFDVSMDYIFARCDDPHGKLYEAKPPVDANNPELRKFVEMCFDPESPMNEKLKEAMLKMLGEAKT